MLRNVKVTITLSASIMNLTPQSGRVREVKCRDCGTNAVLSGLKNNGSILLNPSGGRKGTRKRRREEAAGLPDFSAPTS